MTTPQSTDLQQAAGQVDPSKLADNLDVSTNNTSQQPEELDEQSTTPFIDDSLRTDK